MKWLRSWLFDRLNKRFFFGWVILAATSFSMIGTGPGQSHLIGLYFDPIGKEMTSFFAIDWMQSNRQTALAYAYGIATFLAAFLLPKMGKLLDRHGPAAMLWIVLGCLGLTALLFSLVTEWVTVAIGFGFLRFLGQGALMLACVNMVSQWFDRRRGLALGIMSLGFPISMAVHPPLCQWLMDLVGWRTSWLWLGLSTLVLFLPAALLLAHSKPEPLGLQPDGDQRKHTADATTPVWGLTRREALRTPAFYIITVGLFCLSSLVTTLHVFFKSILTTHGLDAQVATMMFTISGITAAISMPIVGLMLDRCRTDWMFCGGLIIMTASLISITLVNDLSSAIVFAIIFGLNNGVTMTFFGFLWPRYFGRKHLGSIQGVGQMVGIIGASIGAIPLAIAIDQFGDYDLTLQVLAVLPVAAAVLALFLRHPQTGSAKTN